MAALLGTADGVTARPNDWPKPSTLTLSSAPADDAVLTRPPQIIGYVARGHSSRRARFRRRARSRAGLVHRDDRRRRARPIGVEIVTQAALASIGRRLRQQQRAHVARRDDPQIGNALERGALAERIGPACGEAKRKISVAASVLAIAHHMIDDIRESIERPFYRAKLTAREDARWTARCAAVEQTDAEGPQINRRIGARAVRHVAEESKRRERDRGRRSMRDAKVLLDAVAARLCRLDRNGINRLVAQTGKAKKGKTRFELGSELNASYRDTVRLNACKRDRRHHRTVPLPWRMFRTI